ncbi:LysR family transcriptional regulator [Rhodobacteraceae bacterium 2CG4]|uniref:LysR family transcriptional regulator n=1 Tax=Halovulum marinum TaxID=2662447 RepID=A0A6L5YYP8_9RHOB|nr:LysR family transcriptional regulator [Halovulum marinum]MSU88804.1 LysR family transcriptional regulator [Halovulum marinum]
MGSGKFELNQLRCFVCVAEELSFRRAALRLNMTQPPLSRQIMMLEHAVGARLLDRNNRVIRLTAAGQSFLASATEILERAEFAVLSARQAERGEIGGVEMGFVPSAAFGFVPTIIAALSERLPDVTFNPIEMMSYEIVEALRSGRLDFGLTRSRGTEAQLDTVRVISETFLLALPADHPLAAAAEVRLGDLDGQAFIGYSTERGGHLRRVHQGLFAAAGIAPRLVQEVSQTHTVLALVDRGLGAALVPASAGALRMTNLTFRQIRIPARFRSDIYLASGLRRTGALQQRVRGVIRDALAEYAGAGPA